MSHCTPTACLLLIFCAATAFAADAATSARIAQIEPASPALLARGATFYVRIEYSTDEAVQLWARPYRAGTEVRAAASNGSSSHSGSGSALGWFELTEPGTVDEIRIRAGGGKPYREWEVAQQRVDLHWTPNPPTQTARPAWVDALAAAEQAQIREQMEQRASEPVSAGEVVLFSGFMLAAFALLIAGLAIPFWSVWKWRGGWRLAAGVPAALVGFVVLRIVVDTARDPTSHNLWPFEVLQSGALALGAIGVMKLLRRRLGAESAEPPARSRAR